MTNVSPAKYKKADDIAGFFAESIEVLPAFPAGFPCCLLRGGFSRTRPGSLASRGAPLGFRSAPTALLGGALTCALSSCCHFRLSTMKSKLPPIPDGFGESCIAS
jgi:hypothetical protein